MSRPRALALTAVALALLAYSAFSEHLFGLPTGLDVAFQSVVVFPAFASAIWLALPLARAGFVVAPAA